MAAFVLRGILEECVKHYCQQVGVVTGSHELMKFAGVNQDTASRWLRNVSPPRGNNRAQLLCFMEKQGYGVEDLLSLPSLVQDLIRLVGHGLLSDEELAKRLNIQVSAWKQAVWAKLRAVVPLNNEQIKAAEELINEHQDLLAEIRPNEGESPPEAVVMQTVPLPQTEDVIASLKHREVVDIMVSLVKLGLPLARLLESDEFSESERARFRDLVGNEQFFEFTNRLNRLSGPRARSFYRGESS